MAYQSKHTGKQIDDAIDEINNKLNKTGDLKDNVVTFTENEERADIVSGETTSTLFGKILKWLKSLGKTALSNDYNDLDNKPIIPKEYTLPKASANTLGGIKIGTNLTVSEDGTVSAIGGGETIDTSNFATKDKYGDTTINVGRKADTTTGVYSTALGANATASGAYSMSGPSGKATGDYAVALGGSTASNGYSSCALGYGTIASVRGQIAVGRHNVEHTRYAFVVGNGESGARSNACEVELDGSAWFQGPIYVGSNSGKNKDEGSKQLLPTSYGTEDLEAGVTSLATGQIHFVYEKGGDY